MILTLPVSHLINRENYQLIPEIKALEYREPIPVFNNKLDILFHTGDGVVQEEFVDYFDSIAEYLNQNKIKMFSFDLGPACEKVEYQNYCYIAKSKILSKLRLLELVKLRIEYVRSKYTGVLALENLNYFNQPPYFHVCDPDFITEAVLQNDVYMVLDVAHAMITAKNMKMDIYTYLSNLPLDRIKEIHLSTPGTEKGEWRDQHEKPGAEIFKILEFIMKYNELQPYVTIEYYRDFKAIKNSYIALNDYFN